MRRLFVGNLPWSTTEDELRELFGPERVTDVRVVTDRETGRSRGFAFVEFIDEANAEEAMRTHNGSELGGRMIRVDLATERERRPGGGGNGYRPQHGGGGDKRRSKGRSRRRRDDDYQDRW